MALLIAGLANAGERHYLHHRLSEGALTVQLSDATVSLRPLNDSALEVHYQREGVRQLPSFAIAGGQRASLTAQLSEQPDQLTYSLAGLSAVIHKQPFRIQYYRGSKLLTQEESGFFANQTLRGFRFSLEEGEKLLGGGERVLGMDRRGKRLPLYNRAHYGYSTESEQMYFGLPAILSSNKYILLFDNSATGNLDLGASEDDVLQFEAVGGRTSYIIATGKSYPQLMENYVDVTGRQPLPPRWALGNFASRFGYHSEAEVRATVDKFAAEDFPLDAVVLDLYWFGVDIQGHMGNLAWDKNAFPQPEEMIADFNRRGIHTILVTEPFVLSTSERWDQAVAAGALAKNLAGQPKRFDFYFGNTGLIDVFSERAGDWFWNIYDGLLQQGVSGWWGDLGEPEVHPSDTVHAIGMADEIHNAYGHRWAQLLHDRQTAAYPQRRPFIMMRAGFAGSQRFGMIPWTGDVARSWGGLQPQVELALSMGLLGFGYTHSDLGGFAGGDKFDRELYIRWLQYGVFQPVYRPHAQEHIASEPVFHDRKTRDITRAFIKLRYRLLPYNYTLAFENSQTGMPLMRPLFFTDENKPQLMDRHDAYLWGDEFLVAPITAAGVRKVDVKLPGGVWFDYWNDNQYSGDTASIPADLETIPVLVRAGAFIPTVADMANTRDYSSAELTLDYYAHPSSPRSSGYIYEDDGETVNAFAAGRYRKLHFDANREQSGIRFLFHREGAGYTGEPEQRRVSLNLHNWTDAPAQVTANGGRLTLFQREKEFARATTGAWFDWRARQLRIKFDWKQTQSTLKVEF
ncbi:glycoside hydrolase family 31 protein [Microbulbifer sp. 2201CG32-9]|uniref:glycoside hydrolase family 31 protein n=1 Tax=Microbulbifer sp. 2201CG32-9 TaxID=3232309 RepID=UPI00345BED4C